MNHYLKIFIIILAVITSLYLINLYISSSVNPELNYKYKHEYLDAIREHCCDYFVINRDKVTEKQLQTIEYPVIFKPNYCDGFAHGVKLVENASEARKYIVDSVDKYIIVQEFHPGPHEGTVYIRRIPGQKEATVYVVERVNPNANKDTKWLWRSSVSYKYKYYSKHRPDLETTEFKSRIIEITDKLPEVFLVRYDIRFSSYSQLRRGEGFKIIELNEYCSDTRYSHTNSKQDNLKILCEHLYNFYKIGILNIARGNGVSLSKATSCLIDNQFRRAHKCKKYYVYSNMYKKFKKSF